MRRIAEHIEQIYRGNRTQRLHHRQLQQVDSRLGRYRLRANLFAARGKTTRTPVRSRSHVDSITFPDLILTMNDIEKIFQCAV